MTDSQKIDILVDLIRQELTSAPLEMALLTAAFVLHVKAGEPVKFGNYSFQGSELSKG